MKKSILCLFVLLMWSKVLAAQTGIEDLLRNEGVTGSVTIYDLKNDRWTFSDKNDAAVDTIPASTFKIANSLIALQENAIKPGEIIKWDGADKAFNGKSMPAWNADTDIEHAFKNSTIWFYVELAKKIKREQYAAYLSAFNYGNHDLSKKGADFWNYGNFAISPENQIEFLVKLYKNKLPAPHKNKLSVSQENIDYVKTLMIQEKTAEYVLRGKTGWGIKDNQNIGWYVGYIEAKDNAYFFATRIIANSQQLPANFGSSRKDVTLKALRILKAIN